MRPVGSTLTSPRSGEPDGPGRARTRRRGRAARGRARRWCPPAAAPPRSAAKRSTRSTSVGQAGAATAVAATGSQPSAASIAATRRGLAPPRRRPRPWAPSSARPSASRRPGQATSPPHIWRARSMASTRSTRSSPVGAAPSTCRPSRICASLISHSQPSTCSRISSNSSSSRPVGQAEVVVELGGLDQRPDLRADRGQLGRVQRGDGGVLVEQLLEPGDVAVGLGPGHRRDQVVDQRGVRAALGLGALAGVVDQERVDQRQVAERGVGAAGGGHADGLAGQPLQVAVLAEVHDRVGAEAAFGARRGQ